MGIIEEGQGKGKNRTQDTITTTAEKEKPWGLFGQGDPFLNKSLTKNKDCKGGRKGSRKTGRQGGKQ